MIQKRQAQRAYAVDEADILSASPHRLILLLFDYAIASVAEAQYWSEPLQKRTAPEYERSAKKGRAISRAIEFILGGLRVSLNMEKGGDLARDLGILYEYMATQLVLANLRSQPKLLTEVLSLLTVLREAWEAIGPESQAPDASHA